MATLLERRQSNSARLGYLLVIEGCDYAFTDITDIAGTSYLGDGREILPGLIVPSQIQIGVNPRSGMPKESSVRFRLTETIDDKLAALFRAVFDDDKAYRLARRIAPTDTTLASTLNLIGGGTVDPASKHIGTERISSTRTRRDYYIHPGTKPAGYDHPWLKDEYTSHLPPLEMTDEIRVWAGRQVALHEFVYDADDGDWATFTEQHNNSSLVWRGTMQGRGRIVDTLQYEIICDGPASMLRRQLNRKRPTAAFGVIPKIAPTADQKAIAIVPHRRHKSDVTSANNTSFQGSIFDSANDLTSTSFDALQTELSNLLDDVIDGTTQNYLGSGTTASKHYQEDDATNSIFITNDTIGIKYTSSNANIMGRCLICMHIDFWNLLGYDPTTQPLLGIDDLRRMAFRKFDPQVSELGEDWASYRAIDFEGYWICELQTFRAETHPFDDADNYSTPRIYQPLYPGAQVVSIKPTGKQEVLFTAEAGGVYCEGQKCFPPGGTYGDAEDRPKIDGTFVNAMGWFLLEGTIARGADQSADVKHEPFAQVARCCWYDPGDGTIDSDSTGLFPAMVIECLEDPRAFGLDYDKITEDWVSGGTSPLYMTPLGVFAVNGWQEAETQGDTAFRVVTRTLLSSGTAGAWGTTAIPTYPSTGTNAATNGETGDIVSNDAEIADLGLNIEGEAVDLVSFRELAGQTLAGGELSHLCKVKHAYVGPVQAEEVLGSLMQGRGWAMGYKREPGDKQPKWSGVDFYSLFQAGEIPLIDGSYLTITESDLAGDDSDPTSWMPRVDQTWRAPVDAFDVQTRAHPRDQKTIFDNRLASLDVGSHRRSGSARWAIDDKGLSNPDWFSASSPWDWRSEFLDRFQRQIATFMGRPNRVVTLTVSQPKGQWLYPGTAFLLTNSRIPALDGQSMGVTLAPARVIDTTLITGGKMRGSVKIRALLISTPAGGSFGNVWGGSALVSGWTDNGGGSYTLTCEADWLGMGHGGNDVSAFEEPDWSAVGGTAQVRVYQSFDLETFPSADRVTADVSSVTAGSNQITIGSASGTIYEDTLKIITLADYSEQDASNWVRAILSFHTDTVGTTHSSGVAGKQLG